MSRPKTVKGVLRVAKHILEQRGWVQGDEYVDGRFCAAGALYAAAGGISYYTSNRMMSPEENTVVNAAYNVLTTAACGSVTMFNDEPGRTLNEVLEVYDRAIASA